MALDIEEYGLISDSYTGALVGADGSIDWLCLPQYDSASVFGALLGDDDHGRWLLRPSDEQATAERRYDGETLILVTRWTTSSGVVEVTDFMPYGDHRADLVRRVRGVTGRVEMRQDVRLRFQYAGAVPWVRKPKHEHGDAILAVAGPDAVLIRGARLEPHDHAHQGVFTVDAGDVVDLTLTWYPSHKSRPKRLDVDACLDRTRTWWRSWAADCSHNGPYRDEVVRSLILLRALTHEATGGIVAAATTSLPEQFGGVRNWDYRYVWLRDASLTISVLLKHGFHDEVNRWRRWLLRAIAGDPSDVQIMYGLHGERYLPERELDTLPGYRGAAPVRVGNGASQQFQADVLGELMVALHDAREAGLEESPTSWSMQRALIENLEKVWNKPDQGIWEIRGEPKMFTHSRIMVWAAFDRAIKAVEGYGLPGDAQRWRRIRDEVREAIETQGFDAERNTYTQYFGSSEVDAALLQLPQVGYCAPDDPRMLGTVAAIEEDLLVGRLPLRYRSEAGVDGLPVGEHPFLPCAFWLVEQYARSGARDKATPLMDRLLSFANDLGMLSEEYDPHGERHVGNTPQALTHLTLVRAADAIVESGD